MITGIVVALPEELSTLTSRKVDKEGCCRISDNILAACSGAGPKNAKKAANLLISKGSVQLISWGCAAALDTSLKPGDLALPENFYTEKRKRLSVALNWHQHAKALLSPHFKILTDCLAESRIVVSSANDKTLLFKSTGCRTVDMESAAVAEVSANAKIPFLAIRAIADPAEMNLPNAVTHALNENGEVEIKKLLGFLAFHPMEIPALIQLGLHFNSARNKLKSVAKFLDIIVCFDKKTVS